MVNKIEDFLEDTVNQFLFLHIREPENIARAVMAFGAKSLLVKRSGLENITSNYSDANVDNYDYDFVIENNGGLNELELSAFEFVNVLKNNISNVSGNVKVRKKSML